jgi:hypothetical protein
MRKQKFYFGQRRLKHNDGHSRATYQWVVPRILRPYFERQIRRQMENVSLKLAMNSSWGARGAHNPNAVYGSMQPERPQITITQDFLQEQLQKRRDIKQHYRSGKW